MPSFSSKSKIHGGDKGKGKYQGKGESSGSNGAKAAEVPKIIENEDHKGGAQIGALFNGRVPMNANFDMKKGSIQNFFKKMYANPEKYEIKTESAKIALKELADWKLDDGKTKCLTEPRGGGPKAELVQKDLDWAGVTVPFHTLYQLLGFVLSQSTAPPNATRRNHWGPLILLFGKWCIALGGGSAAPSMVCVIFDEAQPNATATLSVVPDTEFFASGSTKPRKGMELNKSKEEVAREILLAGRKFLKDHGFVFSDNIDESPVRDEAARKDQENKAKAGQVTEKSAIVKAGGGQRTGECCETFPLVVSLE